MLNYLSEISQQEIKESYGTEQTLWNGDNKIQSYL